MLAPCWWRWLVTVTKCKIIFSYGPRSKQIVDGKRRGEFIQRRWASFGGKIFGVDLETSLSMSEDFILLKLRA